MSGRPWVPGWWDTARLRLEVLPGLEDMPRHELARELRVSVATLRRYVTGEVCPTGGSILGGPLDALARLLGLRTVDLVEFRPLEEHQQPTHATYSPCPAWCSDHELLVVQRRGLPGEVDVVSNRHLHRAVHGTLSVTLQRLGYADPADPWSATFLDVDGIDHRPGYGTTPRPPSAADMRWLGAELVAIAEQFETAAS